MTAESGVFEWSWRRGKVERGGCDARLNWGWRKRKKRRGAGGGWSCGVPAYFFMPTGSTV